MKQSVTTLINAIKRPAYFLAAIVTLFGIAVSIMPRVQAGQVQNRAIRMSDNGVSGGSITSGVGSGTNVTYRVFFKAASSYTIKGLVLDFCDGATGTPFIGDSTCGAPTAFTVGVTPTIDVTSFTDSLGTTAGLNTGTWTTDSLNSGQTFRMVNSTGVSLTSGTDYTFSISGITNTSTLGTFYARLMTYTSDTGSVASYTHTTPGTYQDYGGFALSTAAVVQVSAKVQETLSFCVSGFGTTGGVGVAPTDCADATAPAIVLGHGTNNTLDAGQVDTNDIWTVASTNALHGLTIRMHTSNACGGLSTDGGTTCDIPAANSGAGSLTSGASGIAAGTAAFGMRCFDSTGGTSGTSPIACNSNYITATASPLDYGMDTTTAGDNVTTTYGDQVASSTAPVNAVINKYDFAATASNTTPAGIYKANLAMIATGTF